MGMYATTANPHSILFSILFYSTLFLCQCVTSPPHLIDAEFDKLNALTVYLFIYGTTALSGPRSPHYRGFTITLNDTHSVGLLWTRDRPNARDLHLTRHNTHNRQTSMPSAGLEPISPARERPKTQALDRAATGTGHICTTGNYSQKMATNLCSYCTTIPICPLNR
jgi:hypothetical protein